MQKIIIAALTLALVGCATSYQPSGGFFSTGGFTETPLANNVVKVTFEGNGYTRGRDAEDMTMLRSAEVMAERGFPYFVLVATNNNASVSVIGGASSTSNFSGTVDSYTGQVRGTVTTNKSRPTIITKPSTTNTVMGFKTPPVDMGVVYETDFIINSLGPKYKK